MATSTKTKTGSALTTTDHDEIRSWVEARGGQPTVVASTRSSKGPGILRIDFPGFSGAGSLKPVDWDDFFERFDEAGLAFLYQDRTAGGRPSRFNKFVDRERAEESESSRPRARAAGSRRSKAASRATGSGGTARATSRGGSGRTTSATGRVATKRPTSTGRKKSARATSASTRKRTRSTADKRTVSSTKRSSRRKTAAASGSSSRSGERTRRAS